MTVTLPIPDELATRLGKAGDLSRRALEAFGLAEYQAGRLRQLVAGKAAASVDDFLADRARATEAE